MKWFSNCKTTAEVKKEYHRLAMKHHPDRNPDDPNATATMQAINAAYHAALAALNGETVTGSDGQQHTYYYNEAREQIIIDKLQETIAAGMQNVTVELVGTWIWAHGDTRPHRDTLKKLGYIWHSKRKMWYFRTARNKRRYANKMSFDDLRAIYGSEKHTATGSPRPAALPA